MMKKPILLFSIVGMVLISYNPAVFAQQEEGAPDTTTQSMETSDGNDTTAAAMSTETEQPATEEKTEEPVGTTTMKESKKEEKGMQVLIRYFIDGGPVFMGIVLICLILGLAFAIERILTLNLATTNVKKLLSNVENELAAGNVDGAKEICRANRSPIASIFYQGLSRISEGLEIVEKSIVSYGSVQMGLLERGLVWISLFIALAPMLGFTGTVIGMVEAFKEIEVQGDISPGVVAGGIKVALLTTLFGLIVAIILQIFYNYIVSKVDGLVNTMEDASISFVDMLVKYKIVDSNPNSSQKE